MASPKTISRGKKNRKHLRAAVTLREREPARPPLRERAAQRLRQLLGYDDVCTWRQVRAWVVSVSMLLAATIAWAFWSTVAEIVNVWAREPDYSHGYLILPIAAYFLWARRKNFPGWSQGPVWAGLFLITVSVALRYLGAYWFLGSVDGWALVVCMAGASWLAFGTRVFWWMLPSILYLFFAVPLPFRIENGLSLTLQSVATQLSTWTLQLLGQPAIAEGRTILLGDTHLEVEHACSGMRIFLGIIAVAFAYLVLAQRWWWEKLLIVAAIIPIALIANATRIVGTGLLYEFASGEAARRFSHDLAGWVMIPFAALLFALLLWYLRLVVRDVDVIDARRMMLASRDA